MVRGRGRQFVDLCLLAFDGVIEGLYQGRLNLLGVDPHPSAVPHIANDTGIPNGVFETIRNYALRMRRRNWSWRAAGLAGVADVIVDNADWANEIPYRFSGRPTEEGIVLRVISGGVINTTSVTYEYSLDGGATFLGPFVTSTTSQFDFGDLSIYFRTGDTWTTNDELVLAHGGRGLHLNDFGAPTRGNVAASSPAGDESILHEIAQQVGACRIRLVTMREAAGLGPAVGMWWTREADGTVWRFNNGPWAWETAADLLSENWARGVIIIDNPPEVIPWEVLGVGSHYTDEPFASFGTTATMEWWNRLYVTAFSMKPAHIRCLSIIVNFDDTKFDPNDAATCMQGDWYNPHKYDSSGNVTLTRPVEYAWFSRPF